MTHLKSVLLIYTGGTIGMYKSGDGGLKAFDLEKLKSREKKSLSVGFAPGHPPSI